MNYIVAIFVLTWGAVAQLNPSSSSVFAQTFNLPISSFNTQSSVVSRSQKTTESPQIRTSSIETSISTIKRLAIKNNAPSKTVVNAENGKIYMITQQEETYKRHEISNYNAIKRLYDSNSVLKISSSILNTIPEGKIIDKFAQLVKVKGQQEIYLIREGVRDIVSPTEFINFGFSRKYILQIQPCFISTFVERDQLK